MLDLADDAAREWLIQFIAAYQGIDAGPGDPLHAVREKASALLDAGARRDDPFTISQEIAAVLPGDVHAAALGERWREELARFDAGELEEDVSSTAGGWLSPGYGALPLELSRRNRVPEGPGYGDVSPAGSSGAV